MTKGEATEQLGIINNKIWHLEETLNKHCKKGESENNIEEWANAGRCAYLIRKLNAKRYKCIAVIDEDDEMIKVFHVSENVGIGREDKKK